MVSNDDKINLTEEEKQNYIIRLKSEENLKNLEHPNLVKIYDSYLNEKDLILIIVMEKCNYTLLEYLNKHKPAMKKRL